MPFPVRKYPILSYPSGNYIAETNLVNLNNHLIYNKNDVKRYFYDELNCQYPFLWLYVETIECNSNMFTDTSEKILMLCLLECGSRNNIRPKSHLRRFLEAHMEENLKKINNSI